MRDREDVGSLKITMMFLGVGMLFLGFFIPIELNLDAQLETLLLGLFFALFFVFWYEWVTLIRVDRRKPTSTQRQGDYKTFLAGLGIGNGTKRPRRRRRL